VHCDARRIVSGCRLVYERQYFVIEARRSSTMCDACVTGHRRRNESRMSEISTAAKESAAGWRLRERGSDRSALATPRYADKRAVSTQLWVCLLAVKSALAVALTRRLAPRAAPGFRRRACERAITRRNAAVRRPQLSLGAKRRQAQPSGSLGAEMPLQLYRGFPRARDGRTTARLCLRWTR